MAKKKKPAKWRAQTLAVRGGQTRSQFQETAEALYLTSGYAYDSPEEAEARFKGADGFTYTRFGNPTVSMFESRMAALEGAPAARGTASGMAAVTAVFLSSLRAGDHVVGAKAMFGACRYVIEDVLPRYGITNTLVDGDDVEQWAKAIRPQTKMLVVDNAFATPALQRPMESGAHIVVHSSTKYIDGQGRVLGGVILCKEDFLKDHLQTFYRNTGPAISPFNAWVHLKSLETLALRMRAHCENAERVADFLAEQKKVSHVLYPFRPDHPQHNLARTQMEGG